MRDNVHSSHKPERARPTKTLLRHIKRRDWDRARSRTLAYPYDAHYQQESDLTPMHLVCLYRAPLDLVELLIDANPSALVAQDSEGWTPLHLTILYGGNEETVKLLIRRGGKIAVSLQSPYAGSPLHLACRHWTSLSIFEALVNANEAMATASNESGTKPAEVLWYQFLKNHHNNYRMVTVRPSQATTNETNHPNVTDTSTQNNSTHETRNPAIEDLIRRMIILLSAAKGEVATSVDTAEPKLMLREVLLYQPILGDMTDFLDIVAHQYPDQLAAPDENGNLLLHLAASNPPEEKKKKYQPNSGNPRTTPQKDSLEILVTLYPAAASVANDRGEFPLHLALKTGRRQWGKSLSLVVEAFSAALELRDQETGLFPYQLACAYLPQNDNLTTETIFQLLVACPHVVRI